MVLKNSTAIVTSLTKEQQDKLKNQAKKMGLSYSSFLRMAALSLIDKLEESQA